jgi:flavin-binding protein dodecin
LPTKAERAVPASPAPTEDDMKRAKVTRLAERRLPATPTGRDGAYDFALKMQDVDADLGADHVYRSIELIGSSTQSIEGAINAALARAHRTLRHLRWFEVLRTSGHIDQGKVQHYQVTLKVGFTMEDA